MRRIYSRIESGRRDRTVREIFKSSNFHPSADGQIFKSSNLQGQCEGDLEVGGGFGDVDGPVVAEVVVVALVGDVFYCEVE